MRSVRRVTRGRCKVSFLIPILVVGYTVGIGVTQYFFTNSVLRPNIKTSRSSHEYFSREENSIRCNCTGHNLAQATRTLADHYVQKHTTIEYDQLEISNEIIKVNGTFYFPFFATDYKIGEKAIKEWITRKQSHCQDNFVGYANAFASLRNIMVDPSKSSGNKGGENISLVMKQSENLEYLKLSKGYFTLVNVSHCDEVLKYSFAPRSHVNMWMKSVILDHSNLSSMSNDSVPQVTIAIQRYEYANLFFVINDLYNVFLMMMVFHIQPSDVTILLIDGHPYGSLDHLWNGLFHDVIRAGHLSRRTRFEKLIWAIPGYSSFFMKSNTKAPYLEAYKNFVINGLGVNDTHKFNCNRLSVLFIWRHDYVAHPRNPKGQISRKIKNEEELINTLKEKFPNYTIRGIQPDLFSFQDQLRFISTTDILIGMHGAGLSHTLFLPKHAALIELYPKYASNFSHFKYMALWRGLLYKTWKNTDARNEHANFYTSIPPKKIIELTLEMAKKLCQRTR